MVSKSENQQIKDLKFEPASFLLLPHSETVSLHTEGLLWEKTASPIFRG